MKDGKISTRLKHFAIKALSIKILIFFGIATVAMFTVEGFPIWMWFAVGLIVFASRTVEKWVGRLFDAIDKKGWPPIPGA
jgi:hypothetical protein